jgi:hypothetical protein
MSNTRFGSPSSVLCHLFCDENVERIGHPKRNAKTPEFDGGIECGLPVGNNAGLNTTNEVAKL